MPHGDSSKYRMKMKIRQMNSSYCLCMFVKVTFTDRKTKTLEHPRATFT